MPNKVVPLGGKHKTSHSAFAELQTNESIEKFVVVTLHKDGTSGFMHLDMTRAELAFASILIQQYAIAPEET